MLAAVKTYRTHLLNAFYETKVGKALLQDESIILMELLQLEKLPHDGLYYGRRHRLFHRLGIKASHSHDYFQIIEAHILGAVGAETAKAEQLQNLKAAAETEMQREKERAEQAAKLAKKPPITPMPQGMKDFIRAEIAMGQSGIAAESVDAYILFLEGHTIGDIAKQQNRMECIISRSKGSVREALELPPRDPTKQREIDRAQIESRYEGYKNTIDDPEKFKAYVKFILGMHGFSQQRAEAMYHILIEGVSNRQQAAKDGRHEVHNGMDVGRCFAIAREISQKPVQFKAGIRRVLMESYKIARENGFPNIDFLSFMQMHLNDTLSTFAPEASVQKAQILKLTFEGVGNAEIAHRLRVNHHVVLHNKIRLCQRIAGSQDQTIVKMPEVLEHFARKYTEFYETSPLFVNTKKPEPLVITDALRLALVRASKRRVA